jgi:hypothetical protein
MNLSLTPDQIATICRAINIAASQYENTDHTGKAKEKCEQHAKTFRVVGEVICTQISVHPTGETSGVE